MAMQHTDTILVLPISYIHQASCSILSLQADASCGPLPLVAYKGQLFG